MKSNDRSRIIYALIATLALIAWSRTADVDAAFWTLTEDEARAFSTFSDNINRDVTRSRATRTVAGGVSCVPASVGLVSWWNADGNAFDSRSRSNGILTGTTFIAGQNGE